MNDFLDTIRKLGPARLAVMGSVLVGLLLFFIFISMRISTPEYRLLYDELSVADSATMAAHLQEANIKYEVSADGSIIKVPESVVGKARMLLAQEGLPNGGSMGYEVFDSQSSFGTTNFVQNINQVRAMEGELARTIGSLGPVRSARVHLVLPQRELFSRESRAASSSVFLGLRPGETLSREQILAIQSLVSSAVPQLKPQNVAIVDSNGNLLARGEDDGDIMMTLKSEEMRRNYERRLTSSVEDLVGRVVGYGKVRANVTADLDFDRVTTEEQIYDPESQVVRSSQIVEEANTEREPPPAEVTVQNNLPGIPNNMLGGAQPVQESSRIEETTNYEISRTVRNMVREVGDVRRLSVAVLVDGTYITDEEGNRLYQPRPEEELDKIAALVQSAIGFDQSRGDTLEITNLQFADIGSEQGLEEDGRLFGFERSDLLDAVEIITVAIMMILVVLLVLQPMVSRLLAADNELEDKLETELLAGKPANPALTGPGSASFEPPQIEEEEGMIDMSRVEGKVKASAVRKVEDIVESYPGEAVSVIRSWMSSDN